MGSKTKPKTFNSLSHTGNTQRTGCYISQHPVVICCCENVARCQLYLHKAGERMWPSSLRYWGLHVTQMVFFTGN